MHWNKIILILNWIIIYNKSVFEISYLVGYILS